MTENTKSQVKVHTFKFSRSDLISKLKKEGLDTWDSKVFDMAMKEVSITKAVDYVLLHSD